MVTPRKTSILSVAGAMAMESNVRVGLPAITPSERELKESGYFTAAQRDLMTVDKEAIAEQEKYLHDMAEELDMAIITKKELREYQKRPRFRIPQPMKIPAAKIPSVKTPIRKAKKSKVFQKPKKHKRESKKPKPKQKKRQKRHVGRNGKVPRKLKGYVFGEDVWKTREPRRRRRKRKR